MSGGGFISLPVVDADIVLVFGVAQDMVTACLQTLNRREAAPVF